MAVATGVVSGGGFAIINRVLVTGATGLVGRYLCQIFTANGIPLRAAVRSDNTGVLRGVEVAYGCDLADEAGWPAALAGVECVVHCAARVHVMKESSGNPMEAFRLANVEGTLRVARLAAKAGVRRFVFLSSAKVLGETTSGRGPYTEADEPRPQDAYGQSKWEAEQALIALAAETGMEVVVVRCPLVYGPGVAGNFLSLVHLADSPWPLPLGGILNARSMVFVGNLVNFLVHVTGAEGCAGQTFLVSDDDDLSTTGLVRMLRAELGRPSRLFAVPWRWLSPLVQWAGRGAIVSRLTGSLQLDIAKAKRQLGWQPPYTVEQGIAETLKHARF